jgi:hypothetical protein
LILVQIDEQNSSAFGNERSCRRQADAARATGDQRGLISQARYRPTSPLSSPRSGIG